MSESSLRLKVNGLSKAYKAPVLKNVSLKLDAGEIHGLVGENGAGKSTFINVLCGLTPMDAGNFILDGKDYVPRGIFDAMQQGVGVALQELSLIDELSIAQNIVLRKIPRGIGFLKTRQIEQRASLLMRDFGLDHLLPSAPVAHLSLAEKQLVELCKAMSENAQLLILDEPTAALSAQQSDILHERMHHLAKQGVSILYVSHRLDDVLHHCDRVSVLTDGTLVKTVASKACKKEHLITWMSKGLLKAPSNAEHLPQAALISESLPITHSTKCVLSAEQLTSKVLANPVSVVLNHGEILGLAGLAGAGRTELLESLFGMHDATGGGVYAHKGDKKVKIKNPAHALSLGLAMLSEDRKQSGIFAEHSLSFNASIAKLERVSRFGLIQQSNIESEAMRLFESLSVKCDSQNQSIEELSGGNQQKVLLARLMFANTQIFLLDEPTRGVDVNTKALIYQTLKALKAQGASCIVASSEVEELFELSDRILVMGKQQVQGELLANEFSEEAVLRLAFQSASPELTQAKLIQNQAREHN